MRIDPSRMFGYGFSPFFGEGEDPSDPASDLLLTEEQLQERMEPVNDLVASYRTYSCGTSGLDAVGRIAARLGATAAIGAWIDANATHARAEVDCAVDVAREGLAEIVVIGNEVIDDPATLTLPQLISYIDDAKTELRNVAVTTAAGPDVWLANPQLIDAVDAVMMNIHPYWAGVHIDEAVSMVENEYRDLQAAAGDKPVIIGETGWPRAGDLRGRAEPSPENACRYHTDIRSWAKDKNIALYYFEVYNEPWKRAAEGSGGVGANWGVFEPGGSRLSCESTQPPIGTASIDPPAEPVGHRVEISGHISALPAGLVAWFVIQGDESFPNLFPQSGPLDIGTVSTCAILGRGEADGGQDDIGKTYTALIVTADTTASTRLADAPADGLRSLPPGASVLATQSLTRTDSATRCGESEEQAAAALAPPAPGVAQTSVITGTIPELTPGHTARLIVRGDPGFPFYFPQLHPTLGPGPFEVCAVFGRAEIDGGDEDVGKVFTIVLVGADAIANAELDSPPPGGFASLPAGATELARVDVQRTRSGGECAVG